MKKFSVRQQSGTKNHRQKQAKVSNLALSALLDGLPALLYYIDSDLRYRYASGGYRHLLGIDPHGVIGRSVSDVFSAEDVAHMIGPLQAALLGEPQHYVRRQGTGDRERFYKVDYIPDRDAAGRVQGLYGVSLDITESYLAERRLEELGQRIQRIVDRLPAPIVYFDQNQTARMHNRAFLSLAGKALLTGPDAFSRVLEIFGVDAEDAGKANGAWHGSTRSFDTIAPVSTKSEKVHLRVVFEPDIDATGTQVGLIGMASDVSALQEVREQFERLAMTDATTSLPNRRAMDERLAAAVMRNSRGAQGMAVLCIDLDDFKPVNDTFGHDAGDHVLNEVGLRMRALLRQTDLVGRVGGDEFVVILENTSSAETAIVVAKKLIAAVRSGIRWRDQTLRLGASVGLVYVMAGMSTTPAELVKLADNRLYEAKRNGKGTVCSTALNSSPATGLRLNERD